jgi:hypothetical protein
MRERNPWPADREPTVDELLSDPIAVALLRSDNLTRRSVEAVLAWVNLALARSPPPAPPAPAAGRVFPLRPAPERGAAVVRLSPDLKAKLELTRAND